MPKPALFLLLMVLSASAASAETFRCRQADGTLVLTDNPANFPAGCRPEKSPADGGTLSVVPTPTPVLPEREPVERSPAGSGELKTKPPWRQKASALVEEYRVALTRRYRTMPVAEKRKVIQKIEEIKKRKGKMLGQIEASRLPRRERLEIKEILAQIPP